MRTRLLALAAVAASLALAAAVQAAPDTTTPLTAEAPEFAWDGETTQAAYLTVGGPVSYDPADCTKDPDTYCEQHLIEIKSGGPVTLDVTVDQFTVPFADFDLFVYKSDAAGAPGEEVEDPGWDPTAPDAGGTGGGPSIAEIFHAENVAPGFYLIVVQHFFNPGSSFKGLAKITGATPVAGGGGSTPPPSDPNSPAPPPQQQPGQPQQPGSPSPAQPSGLTSLPFKASSTLGSAKKAKKKKSLSFKATAGADISNLVLTLIDSKKKKAGSVKIASFPKGSKTIKLKVSKKIKAGKYALISEGTVDGQRLAGSQAVKIKK